MRELENVLTMDRGVRFMRSAIVVIEDDDELRQSITELLHDEGFPVASFSSGAAGLEYLRTSQPPSMILLDLGLPELDGWEIRRWLLANRRLADVPVVVCSGQEADADDWQDLAAADYVAKPLDADRLLRLARQYCS